MMLHNFHFWHNQQLYVTGNMWNMNMNFELKIFPHEIMHAVGESTLMILKPKGIKPFWMDVIWENLY